MRNDPTPGQVAFPIVSAIECVAGKEHSPVLAYSDVSSRSCAAIYHQALVIKAATRVEPDLMKVLDWLENGVVVEPGETPLDLILQGKYAQVIAFIDRCARDLAMNVHDGL